MDRDGSIHLRANVHRGVRLFVNGSDHYAPAMCTCGIQQQKRETAVASNQSERSLRLVCHRSYFSTPRSLVSMKRHKYCTSSETLASARITSSACVVLRLEASSM